MLGIGAISPILPLFAESFGASYGLVGAAISAFATAKVFLDLPGGALADRFDRAPAALGLSLIAAAAALMGNATRRCSFTSRLRFSSRAAPLTLARESKSTNRTTFGP